MSQIQKDFQVIDSVHIYDIEIDVKDMHEMMDVEKWIRDHGFIKRRAYIEDLNEWGRSHTTKSQYLVIMKASKKRILKGYVTQKNKYMKSKISFSSLDSRT